MNSLTRKSPAFRRKMVQQVYQRALQRRGLDLSKYSPENPGKSSKFNHRDFEEGIIPHFLESVLDQRRIGKNKNAFKTAITCLKLHPLDPYYYKPMIYFLVPQRLIRQYRLAKSRLLPNSLPYLQAIK